MEERFNNIKNKEYQQTEENHNNSQNQLPDPLKRRASIGAYENYLNIQKEKEQKKKRLVWKTIESFNDEDEVSNLK